MALSLSKEEKAPLLVQAALWPVQTLMFVYDLCTFPIYYLVQKVFNRMTFIILLITSSLLLLQPWLRVREARRVRARPHFESESSVVFRPEPVQNAHFLFIKQLGVTTVNECIDFMVQQYSHSNMVGSRQVLGEEQVALDSGKVLQKLDLGEYNWQSYVQVDAAASNVGRGLRELGLKPKSNVVIFAETRAEWLICAFGCFKQNFPLVTLYANLGDDAAAHGINETDATHIFTTEDLMPKFKVILEKTPNVTTLIYMKNYKQDINLDGYRSDVKFISLEELMEVGLKSNKLDRLLPLPEDPAIIMYTSGSTGMPKGVVLPHRALVATIRSFHAVVDGKVGDIYLGYLPMAHVFELLSEMTLLMQGVAVGYSSPHTMTDKSTKIKNGQVGDCSLLRPTIMCAVPLVIDRIYKGIQDQIKAKGVFFVHLMKFFFAYKAYNVNKGYTTPILDALIFRKMKQVVGGRTRILISGGAPLTTETHEFVRLAFSVPLMQGYGLTETCACATVMSQQELSTGRNGPPVQDAMIRLIDWPEGNYTVMDKPRPRGEVVVGGNTVATGYYKADKKTAEEFYTDSAGVRWFRTGDIGEMYEDGTLKIIDRKKDLIKLSYGEYVSLGKVESVFKTCNLVDMICVCADPTKAYCVALVVPNQEKLQLLVSYKLGIVDVDIASLCNNADVVEAVLKELKGHGIKSGLAKFELPGKVMLLSEPWTPESGLVTAAFKLKRRPIHNRYSKELGDLYGNM